MKELSTHYYNLQHFYNSSHKSKWHLLAETLNNRQQILWLTLDFDVPLGYKYLILCKIWRISATETALMLPGTILCEFGQICATGNAFVRLTVSRNSILNYPAKKMNRALLCGDDPAHHTPFPRFLLRVIYHKFTPSIGCKCCSRPSLSSILVRWVGWIMSSHFRIKIKKLLTFCLSSMKATLSTSEISTLSFLSMSSSTASQSRIWLMDLLRLAKRLAVTSWGSGGLTFLKI